MASVSLSKRGPATQARLKSLMLPWCPPSPPPQLTNEEVHEFGALNTLLLVVILTMCFLFAYLIKKYASPLDTVGTPLTHHTSSFQVPVLHAS